MLAIQKYGSRHCRRSQDTTGNLTAACWSPSCRSNVLHTADDSPEYIPLLVVLTDKAEEGVEQLWLYKARGVVCSLAEVPYY